MRHKTTNTKTIIAAGCSVVLVGAGIAAIATSCSNNDKTTKSSAINIEGGYNRQAAEEGIVLLKNDNHVLPLQSKAKISVFGMTQVNYFYGGEGSGSIGNTFYRTNVLDGLRRNPDVNLNEALAQHYESKASNYKRDGHANKEINPVIDDGTNWVEQAKNWGTDTAIVILGRSAGEGSDNTNDGGSFRLTNEDNKIGDIGEFELLQAVTNVFSKVVVVLNTTNIIDMSWVNETFTGKIQAILYAWCGGEESGNALASILTGEVNPSGKLPDTITTDGYSDYPTSGHFGGTSENQYYEDIYVGYRYFETFAQNDILYPFGFGLSYTTFAIETKSMTVSNNIITINVNVKNTGSRAGKEVVQVYYGAPNGLLGKASKSLVAYAKTDSILPGQEQDIKIQFNANEMASYDDAGKCAKSAWVLEQGQYKIYVGNSSHENALVGTHTVPSLVITEQLSEALAPHSAFTRITNNSGTIATEQTPTQLVNVTNEITAHRNSLPDVDITGNLNIKLLDVYRNKEDMNDFIGQLSEQDLADLTCAYYDGAEPGGVPGRTALMGGTTENLRNFGYATVSNTDGPAGMRVQVQSTQAPSGTTLAATFNNDLVKKLYEQIGKETRQEGSSELLGPGMDIHRDPLCGRNFEYFSEDPLLTGMMAASVVEGLQSQGISATPKHFAANNQETNRTTENERVSERALREIHLKAFEIVTKTSKPLNIMTSYNQVNERWTHANFELITKVLRDQWGWEGNVMTDWSGDGWGYEDPDMSGLVGSPARIRAGGDIYMPGSGNHAKAVKDALDDESLDLAEVQEAARNITYFIMHSSQFSDDHNLPYFDYASTIKDAPTMYVVQKSAKPIATLNGIRINGYLLNNFQSDFTDYTLVGSTLIDDEALKISPVHTKYVTVSKRVDHLDSLNQDVVTLTASNRQGDETIYRLYSTNDQPDVLRDNAISAYPTKIYINGVEYLGFLRNRLEYNIQTNEISALKITADTLRGVSYDTSRDGNVITLTFRSSEQEIKYKFNLTESAWMPPPVVKVKDVITKIVAANDNFNFHGMQIDNDAKDDDPEMNTKSYLGNTLSGGYAAFNLDVEYGGVYTIEPRVAIWDGPCAFKVTIGETLDSGQTLKFQHNGTGDPKWYSWKYLSGQQIYLNQGHNRIFLQCHSIQDFNCIGFRLTQVS